MSTIIRFATLLRELRLKAGFTTLSEFGLALASQGFVFEDSILSRWQTGERVPKKRNVLLGLIKTLVDAGGITYSEEADVLLESAQQGYLTEGEREFCFSSKDHRIHDRDHSSFIDSAFDTIEQEINSAYLSIYEGYPSIAFERLGCIIQYLNTLPHKSNAVQHLLTRSMAFRLRCFSDLCKGNEFLNAAGKAKQNIEFTRSNFSENEGLACWVYAALRRLNGVAGKINSEVYVRQTLEIAVRAPSSISGFDQTQKLQSHVEIAKIALLLKDATIFNEQLEESFRVADTLPKEQKHFMSFVWDLKARGNIRFKDPVEEALANCTLAKSYVTKGHDAMRIWIQNTELDCLESSADSVLNDKAEQLRQELNVSLSIRNSPYQLLRLTDKKLSGL